MKSWTSPVVNGLAIRPGSERIYFEIVGIVADYKTRGYDNPSWQLVVLMAFAIIGLLWLSSASSA